MEKEAINRGIEKLPMEVLALLSVQFELGATAAAFDFSYYHYYLKFYGR